MSSKAERAHMGRVAEQGCVICKRLGYGTTPAQVHHIRDGAGLSQRTSGWHAIPLCEAHHTGQNGVHGLGTRAFERTYGTTELDLSAETLENIYGGQR